MGLIEYIRTQAYLGVPRMWEALGWVSEYDMIVYMMRVYGKRYKPYCWVVKNEKQANEIS